MRHASRMRWNVSKEAVGTLFLVAVRLGENDSLPARGELPQAVVRTRGIATADGLCALESSGRACSRGRKPLRAPGP